MYHNLYLIVAMIAPSFADSALAHILACQVEEDLDLDDLFWWKRGGARSSSIQLPRPTKPEPLNPVNPVTSPNCPRRSLEGSRWHHCSKLGGRAKGTAHRHYETARSKMGRTDLSNPIEYMIRMLCIWIYIYIYKYINYLIYIYIDVYMYIYI